MTFMVVLQEVMKEKEQRLRQGLNVVGVSHAAYWTSWFIVVSLINVMQTIVLIISGYIYQNSFFLNTPISLAFMVHFVF
jgi:hypothetical protein